MSSSKRIAQEFLNVVVNRLIRNDGVMSGGRLSDLFSETAIEADVRLFYPGPPGPGLSKSQYFLENIAMFKPEYQYLLIHTIASSSESHDAIWVRTKLVSDYSHFGRLVGKSELELVLVDETRHWLDGFPEALSLYNKAIAKLGHKELRRNLLDDLRLSLETLVRKLLHNDVSLEKQLGYLGTFIQENGGSKELCNMLVKLIDYYSVYQNTYVKHSDKVNPLEVEFVVEVTSSFMKYLIKLKG